MHGYLYTPWKRWFAWFPIMTEDRGLVWLKIIWVKQNLWAEGARYSVVVPIGETCDNHIKFND